MKKSIKYIIKLMFVIILPLIVFLFVMNLVSKQNEIKDILGITMLIVITLINAIMFILFMPKTRLLPKTDIELAPTVGFAIGYYKVGTAHTLGIIIPFLLIELKLTK
jgi:predicted permease